MDRESFQSDGHTRRPAGWWVFGVSLLLCVLLAGGKIQHNRMYLARQTTWEQSAIALQPLVNVTYRILAKNIGQPFSYLRSQLPAFRLTGAAPQNTGEEFVQLEEPAACCRVTVTLQDGKVKWFTRLRRVPFDPPPGWLIGEEVRQKIAGYGFFFWLVLFVLAVLLPPYRRPLIAAAFVVVVACILAWLVRPTGISWPNFTLGQLQGIEYTGGWYWWYWLAIALLLNLVTLLILLLIRPKSTEPLCPTCAYNLTGNESGICPECGTKVPKRILRMLEPPPPKPLPDLEGIQEDWPEDPEVLDAADEQPPSRQET